MSVLKLCVTPEDIQRAQNFKISTPLLFVLQRETGTLWRLYEDGLLTEVMAPFRTAQLPTGLLCYSRSYEQDGNTAAWEMPFEIELELFEFSSSDEMSSRFIIGDEPLPDPPPALLTASLIEIS